MAAIVIKKYGNRRLYDTGDSRYVTLEELAAKIRSGMDVRVVDAQTNEDLTQPTLVQIVLEAGNAAKFLPPALLMQMIRLSDDALAEFFSRYVTNALDVYLQAKRGVQSIAQLNPLAQLWMGAPSPFQPYPGNSYATGYTTAGPPYVAPPPAEEPEPLEPVDSPPQRDSDVAAMRRELDELKQVIREGLAAKTPAPKKRRKP